MWIGVHFGSRGLGHKTATYFLKAAGASDGMDGEPCVLSTDSDLGCPPLTSTSCSRRTLDTNANFHSRDARRLRRLRDVLLDGRD